MTLLMTKHYCILLQDIIPKAKDHISKCRGRSGYLFLLGPTEYQIEVFLMCTYKTIVNQLFKKQDK